MQREEVGQASTPARDFQVPLLEASRKAEPGGSAQAWTPAPLPRANQVRKAAHH
jgi:hypothetical protein